jgi:hypothetical protein
MHIKSFGKKTTFGLALQKKANQLINEVRIIKQSEKGDTKPAT